MYSNSLIFPDCIEQKAFSQRKRFILLLFFAFLVFGFSNGLELIWFDKAKLSGRGPIFVASGLTILGFFITSFFRLRGSRIGYNFYFRAILTTYIVMTIANVLGGTMVYGQPLMGIIRNYYRCSGLLLFPILFMWRGDERFIKQLILIYVGIGVLSVVLGDMAAIIPPLRAIFPEERIFERLGLVRMPVTQNLPFVFYYLLVTLTLKKNTSRINFFIVCIFILVVINIFYVSIIRQIIISVIVTVIYYYIRYLRLKIRAIHLSFMICACLIIFVFRPAFFNIITDTARSLYDDNYDGKKNVDIRLDGIKFYWSQFRKTGYVGTGRISTVYSTNNPIAETIEVDKYDYTDLGLFAVLFQYGFPAIILIGVVVFRYFKDSSIIQKVGPPSLVPVVIAIELTVFGDLVRMKDMFFRSDLCYQHALYMYVLWFCQFKRYRPVKEVQ